MNERMTPSNPPARVRQRAGFSVIEVVIAVVIMGILVGGLTSAGVVARSQLTLGQIDVRVWKAASFQMEKILAEGYDNLTAGTDTVQGLALGWTITGTNPKKVVLVVDRPTLVGAIRPDTFVTYVADRTP